MPTSVPTAVKKPCQVIWSGTPSHLKSVGSILIGMPPSSLIVVSLHSGAPSARDNNTVGLFDWLSRGRGQNAQPIVWEVRREGEQVVVEDGRGAQHRVALNGARFVRVVPLSGVQSHV